MVSTLLAYKQLYKDMLWGICTMDLQAIGLFHLVTHHQQISKLAISGRFQSKLSAALIKNK